MARPAAICEPWWRGSDARSLGSLRSIKPESTYKVIQLVGTSSDSWEKAVANAVTRASSSLRDLRIAEIDTLDVVIENGAVSAYRAKLNVSFKYED